jgi:hypothetical protein
MAPNLVLLNVRARLETAPMPDREVDLRISNAIDYKGVFGGHEWHWGAGGDELVSPGNGVLDPQQFVPRWTESIDAAMILIPTGSFLGGLSQVSPRSWYALLCSRTDSRAQWEGEASTAAAALASAALKARDAIGQKGNP